MAEPGSMVGGIITSMVAGTLGKVFIDPGLKESARGKEIRFAVEAALDRIENDLPSCFGVARNSENMGEEVRGKLEGFWKSGLVANELWGCLADSRDPERIPDFGKLHTVYCRNYGETSLEPDLFGKVMEEFWLGFLSCVENSPLPLLREIYLQRLIFLLHKTVYPAEGRQMILDYCRHAAQQDVFAREVFNKFPSRDELPADIGDDQIRAEFFDYRRTRLTIDNNREEKNKKKPLSDEEFSALEKAIIIADGGIGKSRMLAELEGQLAREVADRRREPVLPMYFEAEQIARGSGTKDGVLSLIRDRLEHIARLAGFSFGGKLEGFARYLLQHGRIMPLIDAFDQIPEGGASAIFRVLANQAIFSGCSCRISSRPYKLKELAKGLGNAGRNYTVLQLHPFADHQEVKEFFKGYADDLEPLLEKFEPRQSGRSRSDRDINLLQIPLFARLLKIMAMSSRIPLTEPLAASSRAWLLDKFVRYRVDTQLEKDVISGKDRGKQEQCYGSMLDSLEKLSLSTLAKGDVFYFTKKDAEKHLGSELHDGLALMQQGGFILLPSFLNYEGETCYRQPERHQYLHQIFQEYFAAVALYRLYDSGDQAEQESMFALLARIPYDVTPEVGRFLAEIMVGETKNAAMDLRFWHNLLIAEGTDMWVRTYALQIRDALGESMAREELARIFAEEDSTIRSPEDTGVEVFVPAAPFLRGSYEYEDEWPVRRLQLDDFVIDRYPVTNRRFLDFLRDWQKSHREWKDDGGNQFIYFSESDIFEDKGRVTVADQLRDHQVTGVTWYGAQAFCDWRAEQEKLEWRLPTEVEWEKAARGLCGRRYPGGNDFDSTRCNAFEGRKTEDKTSKVDHYLGGISPYGCFDMAGNVSEWTNSWYDQDEEKTKVLRGGALGAWNKDRDFARCASRRRYFLGGRFRFVGFRCARTVK